MIFKEGRYAVNSPTFTVARAVDTQMQLLKFDEHQVFHTENACLCSFAVSWIRQTESLTSFPEIA